MRIYTSLGVVLGLPWMAYADICDNNCGRAVAGTARQSPPFSARRSECADLVAATVTVTSGPIVVTTAPGTASSGLVLSGTVPAYASSCADITAYWSACQCISGIEATTVTVTGMTSFATSTRLPSSSVGISDASSTEATSATDSIPAPTLSSTETTTTTSFPHVPSSTTDFPSESNTPSAETSPFPSNPTGVTSTSSLIIGSPCTPGPILPSPTTIFTAGDDEAKLVTLPFPIQVFGSTDAKVYVSINGLLSLSGDSGSYTNRPLPDESLAAVSVLALFTDLVVVEGTDQRVAYEVFGSTEGSRTVVFEWRTQHYQFPSQLYHFTAGFEEAVPGVVTFRYYSTTDKGGMGTIGVQNRREGADAFLQYSFNQPNAVPDGTFIQLDTVESRAITNGTFPC